MSSRLLFCSLFLVTVSFSNSYAQEDSTSTPFRKGRWFTGLSGSINSATNKIGSTRTNSNGYEIKIATGSFIKDRWLLEGALIATRSNSEGFDKSDEETLFLGPGLTHYISDSNHGSIFISLSPGFVKYRNEVQINVSANGSESITTGNGFGGIISIGYSYVLHDRIALDLGINLNSLWIDSNREFEGQKFDETIKISDLSFSFGFNVLLDSFFF